MLKRTLLNKNPTEAVRLGLFFIIKAWGTSSRFLYGVPYISAPHQQGCFAYIICFFSVLLQKILYDITITVFIIAIKRLIAKCICHNIIFHHMSTYITKRWLNNLKSHFQEKRLGSDTYLGNNLFITKSFCFVNTCRC